MKILVINAGSSSVKYQLIDFDPEPRCLASGLVERIGESIGHLKHQQFLNDPPEVHEIEEPIPDHRRAMQLTLEVLTGSEVGVLSNANELKGIGHRVVHGGEAFHKPARIDEKVTQAIRECIPLAPLHNPANLTGIEALQEVCPETPQVAVFDTAFHQTLPPHAYRYALPEKLYTEYRVRRYGFHGTSHRYVFDEAAQHLKIPREELNAITLHLGNGASIAAIRGGKCIDTSMGLTPLEGLVMGTRCGDIDPAIHHYLLHEANMSLDDFYQVMNKESGLKGLAGLNDMRELIEQVEKGTTSARLALDLYTYRLRKYIGAYFAALGRVDTLIFTAGIGENSAPVRFQACEGLDAMGIKIDPDRNDIRARTIEPIHADDSRIKILVVPTNEELQIARETVEVLSQN